MSIRKRGAEGAQANGSTKHYDSEPQDVKTDHTRWRLRNDRGRQTWHYLESDKELKEWPQTTADRHYLGIDTVSRLLWTYCASGRADILQGTANPTESKDTTSVLRKWYRILFKDTAATWELVL